MLSDIHYLKGFILNPRRTILFYLFFSYFLFPPSINFCIYYCIFNPFFQHQKQMGGYKLRKPCTWISIWFNCLALTCSSYKYNPLTNHNDQLNFTREGQTAQIQLNKLKQCREARIGRLFFFCWINMLIGCFTMYQVHAMPQYLIHVFTFTSPGTCSSHSLLFWIIWMLLYHMPSAFNLQNNEQIIPLFILSQQHTVFVFNIFLLFVNMVLTPLIVYSTCVKCSKKTRPQYNVWMFKSIAYIQTTDRNMKCCLEFKLKPGFALWISICKSSSRTNIS